MELGYYSSSDMPSITYIADNARTLFLGGYSTIHNMYCRLSLMNGPQLIQLCYNLRKRTGNNKTLIEKTVDLNDRDFLIRNLYK